MGARRLPARGVRRSRPRRAPWRPTTATGGPGCTGTTVRSAQGHTGPFGRLTRGDPADRRHDFGERADAGASFSWSSALRSVAAARDRAGARRPRAGTGAVLGRSARWLLPSPAARFRSVRACLAGTRLIARRLDSLCQGERSCIRPWAAGQPCPVPGRPRPPGTAGRRARRGRRPGPRRRRGTWGAHAGQGNQSRGGGARHRVKAGNCMQGDRAAEDLTDLRRDIERRGAPAVERVGLRPGRPARAGWPGGARL